MLPITAKYREVLASIILELQSNRTVLFGLTNWFSVFVFTGGRVPTAQWSMVATDSYLRQPTAANGLSISELERYRSLVQTIVDIGHTETGGPRTLKCRRNLGDRFFQAASELKPVAETLELSVTKIIEVL